MGRGIAFPSVTRKQIAELPVPLPPLAEQRRIVAKVAELMGLCDALEAAQQEREAVRARLRTSALHQLASLEFGIRDSKLQISGPAAFVLQHLLLFSATHEDLTPLRESVLQLAIQGKLGTQNADDEPAAKLLERIRAAGSQSGVKDKSATSVAEPSFEIPANWIWTMAASVFTTVSDQGKKVQTNTVLHEGRFPVVDQGKVLVRGFCNDENRVIHVSSPVVVFGDHTREVKFIDFDFVVGADGVKVLAPLLIEPRYFYLVLTWIPIESRGYGRHFKLLRESSIPLPPLAEQRRIVAKVDELMAVLDALEATLTTARTTAESLLAATVARLHAA
jgi:type I restriction enzyme S subunit